MPREQRLDSPATSAVAAAAAAALDRRVTAVTAVHEGVNAVYRVRLADGTDAALKTPLLPTDAEFLAEPRVLNRINRETMVPVPAVLTTARANEGPLPGAYFLTRYCEGRGVADLLTLSDAAQERLLREAGRHLAAIHAVRPVDGFGDLRVVGGDLATRPGTATWADRFGELAADAADGLVGDARVADPEPRFADLASDVRAAFDGFPPSEGRDVAPAVLHEDYRPANLVLAPDDASPLTRAVLDFGDCSTGDGLLDLAHAEDTLVDIPLGGTERAERRREILRSAYVERRGIDSDVAFGQRYQYYRLYARIWRLALFDYWSVFAGEDDPDAVAERCRAFVLARLADVT